jgi:hypothetical protein
MNRRGLFVSCSSELSLASGAGSIIFLDSIAKMTNAHCDSSQRLFDFLGAICPVGGSPSCGSNAHRAVPW